MEEADALGPAEGASVLSAEHSSTFRRVLEYLAENTIRDSARHSPAPLEKTSDSPEKHSPQSGRLPTMPYICSMLQDGFKFFKPCRELRPYVRYYWAFKSSERLNALTFPIGCPQIIFHRKSPLRIPELGISQPRLAVSGQVNFPAHLCSKGDLEMVVAVFQPNAMKIFLHLPVFLLHNQEVSGHDLGNNELETLAEKITDCEDASQCVAMTEQWLLAQMANAKTPQFECDIKRTTAAMRQLFAMPETPVAELASTACLGKKQFERLFRNMVGTNPKEYARIVRFQKSLKHLQHYPGNGINLAQLAYRCGYADQSHLVREFKQFSGQTPLSLQKTGQPYSDLFTQPV